MNIAVFDGGTYEMDQIVKAAKKLGSNVKTIYPDKVFYRYNNYRDWPLFYDGKEFRPDVLIPRGINNSRSILCKNLSRLSINVVDPADRFVTEKIPKFASEMVRFFGTEYIPESYFSFSSDAVHRHIHHIRFPVIYKPVLGSHGEGMVLVSDPDSLHNIIAKFNSRDGTVPIFLQEFLPIVEEYRVFVYNGEVVNAARRVLSDKKLFTGRKFVKVDRLEDDILEYIRLYAKSGFVGMDIARTVNGNPVIFEQNRAPEFGHTDKASGISTAENLLRMILK
jgi:glutathione synthase/RimK-type ligase-like ATP-grasp enzyme